MISGVARFSRVAGCRRYPRCWPDAVFGSARPGRCILNPIDLFNAPVSVPTSWQAPTLYRAAPDPEELAGRSATKAAKLPLVLLRWLVSAPEATRALVEQLMPHGDNHQRQGCWVVITRWFKD